MDEFLFLLEKKEISITCEIKKKIMGVVSEDKRIVPYSLNPSF